VLESQLLKGGLRDGSFLPRKRATAQVLRNRSSCAVKKRAVLRMWPTPAEMNTFNDAHRARPALLSLSETGARIEGLSFGKIPIQEWDGRTAVPGSDSRGSGVARNTLQSSRRCWRSGWSTASSGQDLRRQWKEIPNAPDQSEGRRIWLSFTTSKSSGKWRPAVGLHTRSQTLSGRNHVFSPRMSEAT
jgi:hypothetical protein